MSVANEAAAVGEAPRNRAARAPDAVAAVATSPASLRRRSERLLRTARYIPLAQLGARARFMLLRRAYALGPARPIDRARADAADCTASDPLPDLPRALVLTDEPVAVEERARAFAAGQFTYLSRSADFSGGIRWRDPSASPLWLFNLHYLGALVDLTSSGRVADARALLASWQLAFGARWDAVAWHPYPVSLRLANMCFAAAQASGFDALGPGSADLAATHTAFLLRHLEHDLRGNHLFENACALLCAGRYLRGALAARADAVGRHLLRVEIPAQVLADGGHFELSPMYHAIVLQRLLQIQRLLGDTDPLVHAFVTPAVRRMAAFLRAVLCPDGDIPLLGDSARGFAPAPRRLLALAGHDGTDDATMRLGRISLMNSGLHVLRGRRVWTIFDAGPVCPTYLPGHGQADSLTVEIWCDGACIVGDPGVHEYTGPERAWGRSTRAHSTLTLDDADSSEVYGSFRVGGRAQIVSVTADTDSVTATLAPFGTSARLTRTVRSHAETVEITDRVQRPARETVRARLHLDPAVRIHERVEGGRGIIVRSPAGLVRIDAEHPLSVEPGRASRRYGSIAPTTILVHTLAGGETVSGRLSVQPLGHP